MILNRRIFRAIKYDWIRYGALFFLITLGIMLVVSMACQADSVIHTVEKYSEADRIEDGSFSLLIPLPDTAKEELEKMGITVEEAFYIDIEGDKNSKLRIFKNRKDINRIHLEEGRQAETDSEIVLEKHYAFSHSFGVGDSLSFMGKPYRVTGLGSVPEYHMVQEKVSDVVSDPKEFSLAFVTGEAFEELTQKANANIEYCYSYLLNNGVNDRAVKEYLTDMKFDTTLITDAYYIRMMDEIEHKKQELIESTNALVEGSKSLTQGSIGLNQGAAELKKGSSALLEGADNLLQGTDALSEGAESFQEGAGKLYAGTRTLEEGSASLLDGLKALDEGTDGLEQASAQLAEGSEALYKGAEDYQEGILQLVEDSMEVDYTALSYFLPKDQNPRITSYREDSDINKIAALIIGVIFIVLIAYIFSVFVVHEMDAQSAVIGALFSMGYLKKELLRHYLILPMLVTGCGGICGTILGFWRVKSVSQSTIAYYSLPPIEQVYPIYLICYGMILPVLMAFVIHWFVIRRKLSLSPLMLLRREKKERTFKALDLKNMGFIGRFRTRQIFMEIRGTITLFLGLFLAIFLLVFGFCIYGSITYYTKNISKDIHFQNLYLLKGPLEQIPEEGEPAYLEGLYSNYSLTDREVEVTLKGIHSGNPYFDFSVEGKKNEVFLSDSAARKFGWSTGDKIILSDNIAEKDYAFEVAGIVPYANGLTIFMNLDSMRESFGKDDGYYNALFSEEPLSIDQNMLSSTVTADDTKAAADIFLKLMWGMIATVVGVSVLLFLIVMYLLMKMMIDRAAFSISLLKVFGYQEKEVSKIYLGSNFYIVTLAAVFSIPISKLLLNRIFPYLISNVSAGMKVYLGSRIYLLIVLIIFISYFTVNYFLRRHLKKISLAEVLKERE